MKLYLCSYRIQAPDELAKLVGKKPAETKVAIIPNARDYYALRARKIKIQEIVKYLAALGYQAEVVDLWDYDKPAKLRTKLQGYDMLWVAGGNTYCLRYEMKCSGFDEIVKDLLEDGVVYAGESAGAVVAGTTLHGVESADVPEFAQEIVWDGLNLVPKFVLPHADNPMFTESIAEALKYHKDNPNKVLLKDSEALAIDGGEQRIVAAPAA